MEKSGRTKAKEQELETVVLFLQHLAGMLKVEFSVLAQPDTLDRLNPKPDVIALVGEFKLAIELTAAESYNGERQLETEANTHFMSRFKGVRTLAEQRKLYISLPFELARTTSKKGTNAVRILEPLVLSAIGNALKETVKIPRGGVELLVEGHRIFIAESRDDRCGLRYFLNKNDLTNEHAEIIRKRIAENTKKFQDYSDYQKVLLLHSVDYCTHDNVRMREDFARLNLDSSFSAIEDYDQIWFMQTSSGVASKPLCLHGSDEIRIAANDINFHPMTDRYWLDLINAKALGESLPEFDDYMFVASEL